MKNLIALFFCIAPLLVATPPAPVIEISKKPVARPNKPLYKVEASPQIPSKFPAGHSNIILRAATEGTAEPLATAENHQKKSSAAVPQAVKSGTPPQVEQWVCFEQVTKERGAYLIEWRYTFQRIGGDILAHGNKYRVNGKPATWGEEKTISVIWLHEVGGRLEGTYEETNHKGQVMRGRLFGRSDPDGRGFVAEAFDGEVLIARLTASPQAN